MFVGSFAFNMILKAMYNEHEQIILQESFNSVLIT